MTKSFEFIKKNLVEIVFFTIAFLFSGWLMWHSFGYDSQKSQILISSKVWSDFANHIPLIRSFSMGANFPPEFPLFPGEPIKYHFLFYTLVGLLEKTGLRLDWALNVPSSLSFFGLMVMIFLVAKLIFKSRFVAILSVVFFLFNGTFSFLEFFKSHPLSFSSLKNIYLLKDFPSFMPYGPGEITAFWSLDTFINQRHLALAFGLILTMVYLLIRYDEKKQVPGGKILAFLGLALGLFPSLHKAAFIMALAILALLFLLFPKLRMAIFKISIIAFIVSVPQLIFTNQIGRSTNTFSLYTGYLVHGRGLGGFIRHWMLNFGLNCVYIPLGFLLAPARAKKIFLAFLSLFFIGNLFKFSPEIAVNHKFFNLFIIVGNMVSAYFIYRVWQKKIVGKILAIILFLPLVFSGIIDFFPIKNDFRYTINDVSVNEDATWIKENTPPNSVFLNISYLYHPASLAGRKVYYGWPYFTWSAGYDTDKRLKLIKQIYEGESADSVCSLLEKEGIDYVETQPSPDREEFLINYQLFENKFILLYNNPTTGLRFYDVKNSCASYF